MLLSFFGGILNTVTEGRLWLLVLCYLGETETTFCNPLTFMVGQKKNLWKIWEMGVKQLFIGIGCSFRHRSAGSSSLASPSFTSSSWLKTLFIHSGSHSQPATW